jgi:Restriction endonuclease
VRTDGKQLEGLVSFVERMLLPQGFEVTANERVYNDEGIQIAEFDIEIKGRVGSTDIAWLIECRDRPQQGPAPGSWIEQLVGRRMRFGFNKVTAVSTTGFAVGASEFAKAQGIETREVKALSSEEFANWLALRHLEHVEQLSKLDEAKIITGKHETDDRRAAVSELISRQRGDAKFLRSTKSGELVSATTAFISAVSMAGTLFEGIEENGPGKRVTLEVRYTNENDYFVVDTAVGPVRALTTASSLSSREMDKAFSGGARLRLGGAGLLQRVVELYQIVAHARSPGPG